MQAGWSAITHAIDLRELTAVSPPQFATSSSSSRPVPSCLASLQFNMKHSSWFQGLTTAVDVMVEHNPVMTEALRSVRHTTDAAQEKKGNKTGTTFVFSFCGFESAVVSCHDHPPPHVLQPLTGTCP